MKHLLSLLGAIVASSLCLFAQELPFRPEDAYVISDPSDLVAHCSTFAFKGRDVYFAYYKDSEQPKEHSVHFSTFPAYMPIVGVPSIFCSIMQSAIGGVLASWWRMTTPEKKEKE